MLVGGGQDCAAAHQIPEGGDVVEPDDADLVLTPGGLDGGHGAERHVVVGAEQGLELRVGTQDGRGHVVGFFRLPLATLGTDDRQTGGLQGVLEPEAALLAVERGRDPLDDRHGIARLEDFGQRFPDGPRPGPVVRPDKGNLNPLRLERRFVEFIVDVDHRDTRLLRLSADMHERLGVGGRDDDGVHLRGDHLVDQRHLLLQVAFVLNAVDLEVVLVGILFLVGLGSVGHRDEKLVGQRLHDQRDARLAGFGRFRLFPGLLGCGSFGGFLRFSTSVQEEERQEKCPQKWENSMGFHGAILSQSVLIAVSIHATVSQPGNGPAWPVGRRRPWWPKRPPHRQTGRLGPDPALPRAPPPTRR